VQNKNKQMFNEKFLFFELAMQIYSNFFTSTLVVVVAMQQNQRSFIKLQEIPFFGTKSIKICEMV